MKSAIDQIARCMAGQCGGRNGTGSPHPTRRDDDALALRSGPQGRDAAVRRASPDRAPRTDRGPSGGSAPLAAARSDGDSGGTALDRLDRAENPILAGLVLLTVLLAVGFAVVVVGWW